jgi:hypothetical protein
MKQNISAIFVAASILVLPAVPRLLAAFPPEEKRGWQVSEGPAVPFEEEEEEDLFQRVRQGEVVFLARVDAIRMQDASLTQIPVPVTLVSFREIERIKGKMPSETAFRYPRPPETLKLPRGVKVLVVLDRGNAHSQKFEIAWIGKANKTNLDLARVAAEEGGSPA